MFPSKVWPAYWKTISRRNDPREKVLSNTTKGINKISTSLDVLQSNYLQIPGLEAWSGYRIRYVSWDCKFIDEGWSRLGRSTLPALEEAVWSFTWQKNVSEPNRWKLSLVQQLMIPSCFRMILMEKQRLGHGCNYLLFITRTVYSTTQVYLWHLIGSLGFYNRHSGELISFFPFSFAYEGLVY